MSQHPQAIEPTTPQPKAPASKEGTSRHVQEKIMVGLSLVFIGGVVLLTVVPEPFNHFAMPLIVFLTIVAMFKTY